MSFAVRNSRFPHMCRASRRFPYMCRALLRFPHLSFIPPVPYPPLRGTFPLRGRLCLGYCFSTHACIRSDDMEIALLSQMAYLRRSFPLFFIPLEPYPARSARHLPHAGKALPVVILFPHMRVFVLTLWEKRFSRIVAFPLTMKTSRD